MVIIFCLIFRFLSATRKEKKISLLTFQLSLVITIFDIFNQLTWVITNAQKIDYISIQLL